MKNINNTNIQELADHYATEENSAYTNDYYGFIAGFNAALEQLSKEYTEISLSTDTHGRLDVLARIKDLQ